jgi:hypothetical protein
VALGEEEEYEDQPQEHEEYEIICEKLMIVQTSNGTKHGILVQFVLRSDIIRGHVGMQPGVPLELSGLSIVLHKHESLSNHSPRCKGH